MLYCILLMPDPTTPHTHHIKVGGRKLVGKQTLVALDTDHIKQYVFATDRLKDIRGASSILDALKRRDMNRIAKEFHAQEVYTNGGSGTFVVDGDESVAKEFVKRVQREYAKQTWNGASISFAVHE